MRKESTKGEKHIPELDSNPRPLRQRCTTSTLSNVIFKRGIRYSKTGPKKIMLLSLLIRQRIQKILNNCQIEFWDKKLPKH